MKRLYILLLVFLLLCPLTAWAGETRIDQLHVEDTFSNTTPGSATGTNDAYVKDALEVDGVCDFGATTIKLRGITYTLPTDDGDASEQLQTDGSGVLTWEAAGGSATAWDDIGNPDANDIITFGTYTATLTGTSTAADQFNFLNTGNFGDVSVVKIQQLTGNPTNGTMLEVTAADSNVDGIVVSNTTADLDADATLLTLSLTDDGDANGIYLNCLDNAGVDSKFKIADDGNTTIAGTLGVTGAITASGGVSMGAQALTGTTGLINYTNFDVDAAGNVAAVGGTFSGNVGAVAGTFSGDLTVSGAASLGTLKQDALVPSSASPQAISLNGGGAGGVNIGNVSTGAVAIGGTSSGITLGASTTMSDGKNFTIGEGYAVIDNDATDETALTITSDATTSGGAISIVSKGTTTKLISEVADDLGTGGMMLYLDSDNIAADNYYAYFYDGTNPDFTVSANGATVIAGAASTDMLTITAGDIQITAGDIDLDNGQLMVDTAQDLSNNISRNFDGAGSAAVLVVNDDHTSSTNIALDVNQDGTGGSTGVRITHDGTSPALTIGAGAARTGDVIAIPMANQLADRAINITGAITSVAGGGTIEVHGTGVIPATASLLRLDADTAQPGDGDGWMLNIDDDTLVVATPSKYAVLIDSNANEALHVATGKSLFDELATFTSGVTANGTITGTFSDNAESASLTASAADYAANSAILSIVGSAGAGQTNASYLLQLDRNAAGDAQDNFIRCRDNAYADTKFAVDSGGAVTIAGAADLNGAADIAGVLTLSGGQVNVFKGGDIASPAGGELDLTAGTFFDITGVNNITSIAAADSIAGRLLILQFDGILTFTDGNNLKIAGNFVTSADDTITLICDGTNWWEMARSAN